MTISIQNATAWLAAAGLMAAVLTVSDKRRARRGAYRVPERTLWLVALLGGSAVMYLTMCAIRHKTKHRRFMWGLPLLFCIQLGLCALCVAKGWILPV